MDSSSFKLTLRPSKIYVPKVWSNFLDDLSKMHLPERLVVVRKLKLVLEQEVTRLATSRLESFIMLSVFLKNAIKALEEEEEVIVIDMKKFQTPILYVNMSKDSDDAEDGILQGGRSAIGSSHKTNGILALVQRCRGEGNSSGNSSLYRQHLEKMAPYQHEGCLGSDSIVSPFPPLASGDKDTLTEMLSRRAEPSTRAMMFGTDSFHPECRQMTEVMRNLYKRQRASEESSQAPLFCPSFGAKPTSSTSLPSALSSLSLSDGYKNQVPSFFGSSDTMLMKPIPQMVPSNGKRVLENPRQPSSETIFTRHVPRMNLDKGKRILENPSSRLLFRSSKAELTRPANLCHAVAPTRALAAAPTPPAPATAPAALDKGKQALEEPI